MTRQDLNQAFSRLSLREADAARLLSVDARTIRRWLQDPTQVPGPAEQALRAWLRLDELGLAWRPDALPIGEEDSGGLARQIELFREHAIQLKQLLDRVEARGGPAAPWEVNLEKRKATLNAITITFYPTANGSFSPQGYSRRDKAGPDLQRDWSLIEDGFAAVAAAIADAGEDWAKASSERATVAKSDGRSAKTARRRR